VKRRDLERHLRQHGCFAVGGTKHTKWRSPNGVSAIPRTRTERADYAGGMPSWDDVLEIARDLPGIEEATSYGTPSLKVRRKFLCRMRTDPDALVMRVIDMQEQEALVKGRPDVFFLTPHYEGYPYVLIRLDEIDRAMLAELLEDAWRTQAPKTLVAERDG
jgi:hypothetical protein